MYYCELNSKFRHSTFEVYIPSCVGTRYQVLRKLIFALLVLPIDIPLSLSVDYHSQVYSMHDLIPLNYRYDSNTSILSNWPNLFC